MTSHPQPACLRHKSLFQHELLDEPPVTALERRQADAMTERATELCLACPLFTSCLFAAVVTHDIAGFVAATTEEERDDIRAELGVNIPADDIDAFTGVQRPGAPIRQEDVVRLRKANPDSSLESIAMQLGCSLSTVKRHLRRARAGVTPGAVAPRPQPPMSEVLAAFRKLQRRAVVAA